MPPFFLLLNLLLWAGLPPTPSETVAAPPTTSALKNCPTRCGIVSLPYPFGFRDGCHRQGFHVECNSSFNAPFIQLPDTDLGKNILVSVTNVSLDEVVAQLRVIRNCGPGVQATQQNNGSISMNISRDDIPYTFTELRGSPYTLSYTRNKLVILGRYSVGQVHTSSAQPAAVCASSCLSELDIVNGSCTVGSGCCQSSIPKNMKNYFLSIMALDTSSMNQTCMQLSRCSYAFLMDSEQYVFRSTDLYDYYGSRGSWLVPVVLDWAIANYSCSEARRSPDYACGTNAHCVNSTNGPGYRCSCNTGYTGNPYVADGCQGPLCNKN